MAAADLFKLIMSDSYVPRLTSFLRPVQVVKPLRFSAPRPEAPRASFKGILEWTPEEEPASQVSCRSDEDEVSTSATRWRNHPRRPYPFTSACSGRSRLSQVVTVNRIATRGGWGVGAAHAMPVSCSPNDAPQWPPAQGLVANPPDWGTVNPGPSSDSPTSCPTNARYLTESAASMPVVDPPQSPVASAGASSPGGPGWVVGAKGLAWPLPDEHFMPSPFSEECAPWPLIRLRAFPMRKAAWEGRCPASSDSSAASGSSSSSLLPTPPGFTIPPQLTRRVGRAASPSNRTVGHGRPVPLKVRNLAMGVASALGLNIPCRNLSPDVEEMPRLVTPEQPQMILGSAGIWWPLPPSNPLPADDERS